MSFTYDAVGNPLSYNNGTAWKFTWENAHDLATAKGNGKSISYHYDMDGVRDSKTVDGVKHEYITQGGNVTLERWNDGEEKSLEFIYDNGGAPYSVIYSRGNEVDTYYYILNQQGDVIRIVDTSGKTVAEYTYNGWGEILNVSNAKGSEIGTLNPIRYRGYYYDSELNMYYLQSRYYDPVMKRMICADDEIFIGATNSLLSHNLFTYCENSPVNMVDSNGHAAINVIFAVVGGIAGWKLGDYVAKKLGYYSGKKYWAIRTGVTVGGVAIGWFSARLMTRILANYLRSNPSVVFKFSKKMGASRFFSTLKFLGINPFTLSMNQSKFIAIARLANNRSITLSYNWAVSLYKKARSLGLKVSLDRPHGGYGWHMHISGANGKLRNLHIQITKSAWDYLAKIIG